MGQVIDLAEQRARRRNAPVRRMPRDTPVVFNFDLSCPFSYLSAERVDRLFPTAVWQPVSTLALHGGDPWADPIAAARAFTAAGDRARDLRIPLVWPERRDATAAMRAASLAADAGRGAPFALAAARLAFCGGFDLDDPEVLAEAAAAAGLGLEACMQAAGDRSRDGVLEARGLSLLAGGATRLPVIEAGGRLFSGERSIAAAWSALRGEDTLHRGSPPLTFAG